MRTRAWSAIPVVLVGAIVTACGPAVPAAGSPATGSGPRCDVVPGTAERAQESLDAARPGTVVCIRGTALAETDLRVARSGTARAPITLLADGAPVRSVQVAADHVVVQGFATVPGGGGIDLAGAGLVARRNDVRGATDDGIVCDVCTDAVIEDNVVVGADGSGINAEGDRTTVRRNRVSESVRRAATDADGIRFFGTRIVITENEVHDITRAGYGDAPPHTDCFQTFDNSSPPTVDALISANTCRNVDDQCLIATAEEAGRAGDVGRSRNIRFVDNICEVGGAQAILAQWMPGVAVRGNRLGGPALDRGAYFGDGSTGGEFFDNVVPPGVAPYQLDETSRQGFVTDRPA